MTLQIPKTAANPVEWIRRAADAVNAMIKDLAALVKRTTDLETFQGTATTSLTSLGTRTTALETYTHTSFTLTPAALPGSPVEGQTVYDSADKKVKTWDGVTWQAHY